MSLIISCVCIVLLFFFMVVRPQKKNAQRHQALIESLKAGDEIITTGGIYGTVRSISDDSADIEIAENTTIRISKRAIAMKKVEPSDSVDSEAVINEEK